ncbi:MAG: serine protease [Planctomycetota bacterium]|nr:serine protease [Planctomycetota bacterium]
MSSLNDYEEKIVVKTETWKVVLVGVALCATIVQVIAIFFYSPTAPIMIDDPVGNTSKATSLASGSQTSGVSTTIGSNTDTTDSYRFAANSELTKLDVEVGDSKGPRSESSKNNAFANLVLDDRELKELIQLASVEIIHPATGTQGSGVVVDLQAGIGTNSDGQPPPQATGKSSSTFSRNGFEVMTACHVVKDKEGLVVAGFRRIGLELERTEYRAITVLAYNEDADLARIFVETPDTPAKVVQIAMKSEEMEERTESKKIPERGVAAWGLSWTGDGRPIPRLSKIREHRYAQRESGRRVVGYWVIDSSSVPGMSGGPLLDRNGFLIGIASGNSGGAAYYLDEIEISRLINRDLSVQKGEN